MNIPGKVLDEAYAIYEEWEPNRRIDRAERLKQEVPSLTEAEIASVIKETKWV
jgi:hypothetical protein